jgi:hypothetical protein
LTAWKILSLTVRHSGKAGEEILHSST